MKGFRNKFKNIHKIAIEAFQDMKKRKREYMGKLLHNSGHRITSYLVLEYMCHIRKILKLAKNYVERYKFHAAKEPIDVNDVTIY